MITITEYDDSCAKEWDDFVENHSANGTLFHTRKFLDYHIERSFDDRSIMLYQGNELVSVLAACLQEDGSFFSHPGTSCGGPVICRKHYKIDSLCEVFASIEKHYNQGLGMKICEDSLIEETNSPLLYHFGNHSSVNFELSAFKTLSPGDITQSIPNARTRSSVRKIFRERDHFAEATSNSEYLAFHSMLEENLKKHKTVPTHSAEELLKLKDLLGADQKLVLYFEQGHSIASGVWMIRASPKSWHTQYIVKNYDSTIGGLVEASLVKSMELARDLNFRYLSLGVSTENKGAVLNRGLSRFKEKLGCNFLNRYILNPGK